MEDIKMKDETNLLKENLNKNRIRKVKKYQIKI